MKNLDIRMTLRLSNEQMDFISKMGKSYGLSPSEYLRMLINCNMSNFVGGSCNEDKQTIFNDKLQ
jgi:predicted DNA binding CopG/RHH family protein